MSRILYVQPTGNANTDTANILSARDALNTPKESDGSTLILTGGDYQINQSLVFGGDPNSNTINPPRIVGAATAFLHWAGSADSDEPLLVYNNAMYSPGPALQNLVFRCWSNCRGVRVQRCNYNVNVADIFVHQPRKIGLDVIDCWGTTLRNIAVKYGTGIMLRGVGSGSCRFVDLHMQQDGTSASDYPDPTEELVQRYNGTYVQTSTDMRAGLVLTLDNSIVEHILLEGCDYGSYPLLAFDGSWTRLEGMRFEDSIADSGPVKLKGVTHVRLSNLGPMHNSASAQVRATGDCKGIHVSDSWTRWTVGDSNWQLNTLLLDGGTHAGHCVERIRDPHADTPPPLSGYIGTVNNPTLSGEISADNDHSVSIPWQ